jgi:hypothetical protein
MFAKATSIGYFRYSIMKAIFILFIMAALASCTNNSSLSGANNNDTVELQDEFGREAYPEMQTDSVPKDSLR